MTESTSYSAPALPLDQASQILSTLPPVHFAFAYGSAIVPQRHADPRRRMIDLVVVVDDALDWHQLNISRNPTHYSVPMTLLGPSAIASLQRSSFGARVYYNTVILPPPIPSFKYGVVELRHLRDDLLSWHSLYLSGRLHKPVHLLTHTRVPASLADAMAVNLNAAAAAALLMLPSRFRERDLYAAIARLSYLGDVRLNLPLEPSSKVFDIVSPNLDRFRNLYARTPSLLAAAAPSSGGLWTRAVDPATQGRLLRTLPSRIRSQIADSVAVSARTNSQAAHSLDPSIVANAVIAVIGATVARSSFTQTVKGIATAGLTNSLRYVGAKLRKTLKSASRRYINT